MDGRVKMINQLRQRFRAAGDPNNPKVVIIIGTGVSAAATANQELNGHTVTSWPGLLRHGVDYARKKELIDANQVRLLTRRIEMGVEENRTSDLVLAATDLFAGFRKQNTVWVGKWMQDVFESLQVQDRTLIEVLNSLPCLLTTLNYDHLIEDITNRKPFTWRERNSVDRFLNGSDHPSERVFHLHGSYQDADSIVFDDDSYQKIVDNQHTQQTLKTLFQANTVLFVGCGLTIEDLNFSRLINWANQHFEQSPGVQHYLLCEQQKMQDLQGRLAKSPWLSPLSYGEKNEKLPEFLRQLSPSAAVTEIPDVGPANSSVTTRVIPSASIQYYLTQLVEQTKNLELMGLGRSYQVDLPIEKAYVPLRTWRPRELARKEYVRPQQALGKNNLPEPGPELMEKPREEGLQEFDADVQLEKVFQESQKLGNRGVILLGEPGSGKTTGARQLAWRLASRESTPESLGLPAGIRPALLKFRNLKTELINAHPQGLSGLRAFLEQETHCDGAPDGAQSAGTDLWNEPQLGLLWVLDGLDEIVDPKLRAVVAGWIRAALPARPRDWFLVTSRFQGYLGSEVTLGAKFVEFHVKPLSAEDVKEFVPKWFGVAQSKLHGPGDVAERKANADSQQLLDILARPAYRTTSIREIVSNPLLLTILCVVFHEERNLPYGRAELYEHCVKVLLQHWRRAVYEKQSEAGEANGDQANTFQRFDADAAQKVLAQLAWWLHQQEQRTTGPLAELAQQAEPVLADIAAQSGLGYDGRQFIDRMRTESGILAMGGAGNGECGFLHLSFQEFLAADYAACKGLAKDLASRISESWWREVALLSLRRSQEFCEEFFRELLALGIAEREPDLASRCLEETRYFSAGPFLHVLAATDSPPSRVAAVLGLLRERKEPIPELTAHCERLMTSEDDRIRSAASEILVRRHRALPASERVSVTTSTTSVTSSMIAAGDFKLVIHERTGVSLVSIPPGEFLMGSTKGASDERPVRRVKLTRAFLLGKYPVTNAQYARYLAAMAGKVADPKYWSDRKFNQPEQPVVGVSWDDVQGYCRWAGGRLPTEAEWEYACRAGCVNEYCFGDDDKSLGEYAWYGSNSNGQLQTVGQRKPNTWGLHDMHGNVWEWCEDWYGEYDERQTTDPQGPSNGSNRVTRGGSWWNSAGYCRSAYRHGNGPANRWGDYGFRLALSPSSSAGSAEREQGADKSE